MRDYFSGSAWSATNAKKALPILVNFAESQRPTTYSKLSQILFHDKEHARAIARALGRLGKGLEALGCAEPKRFGEIPRIQLLVCNKKTKRPGNTALSFLGIRKSVADRMLRQELDSIVRVAHNSVFSYRCWRNVLRVLGLKPVTSNLPRKESILPRIEQIERRHTGEGEEHKRLKLFLAENPRKIGVRWKCKGDTEVLLLSGDRLDVSFRSNEQWIAVEVKGRNSPEADLVRGIFQCVKYKVIMAAHLRYEALSGANHARLAIPKAILGCGCGVSTALREFAESLDVEIRMSITVPDDFVPRRAEF